MTLVHMHLFYDPFITVRRFGYLDVQWKDRKPSGFIKNISICALKINLKSCGFVMTEFNFLVNYPSNTLLIHLP